MLLPEKVPDILLEFCLVPSGCPRFQCLDFLDGTSSRHCCRNTGQGSVIRGKLLVFTHSSQSEKGGSGIGPKYLVVNGPCENSLMSLHVNTSVETSNGRDLAGDCWSLSV